MMNLAVLTISRYPAKHKITAFHSMALFRPSLALNKAMAFHKLMGTGRNGTFDKNPDWQQYAIFSVSGIDGLPPIDLPYQQWRKKYYGALIVIGIGQVLKPQLLSWNPFFLTVPGIRKSSSLPRFLPERPVNKLRC